MASLSFCFLGGGVTICPCRFAPAQRSTPRPEDGTRGAFRSGLRGDGCDHWRAIAACGGHVDGERLQRSTSASAAAGPGRSGSPLRMRGWSSRGAAASSSSSAMTPVPVGAVERLVVPYTTRTLPSTLSMTSRPGHCLRATSRSSSSADRERVPPRRDGADRIPAHERREHRHRSARGFVRIEDAHDLRVASGRSTGTRPSPLAGTPETLHWNERDALPACSDSDEVWKPDDALRGSPRPRCKALRARTSRSESEYVFPEPANDVLSIARYGGAFSPK